MGTITDSIKFKCPSCGLEVVAGSAKDMGVVPDGTPTVMHAEPQCETFNQLDPDEYLKWVRHQFGGTTDS